PVPALRPPLPTRRSSDLAGPGAGLDHGNRRLSIPMAFFVQAHSTEQLGHLGDHQSLAVTRLQRLVFEEGTVGRLDLGVSLDEEGDRKSTRLNSSHVKISY